MNESIEDVLSLSSPQTGLNSNPWGDNSDNTCDTFYYAMHDANFNVLGLADSEGTLAERYEYSPYGQRTVYTPAGSNDPLASASIGESRRWTVSGQAQPWGLNDFGHQGLMHDKEFDAVYNRRREYIPRLGRFAQRDPIEVNRGLYDYCGSSPINCLDWAGLSPTASQPTRLAPLLLVAGQDVFLNGTFRVVGWLGTDTGPGLLAGLTPWFRTDMEVTHNYVASERTTRGFGLINYGEPADNSHEVPQVDTSSHSCTMAIKMEGAAGLRLTDDKGNVPDNFLKFYLTFAYGGSIAFKPDGNGECCKCIKGDIIVEGEAFSRVRTRTANLRLGRNPKPPHRTSITIDYGPWGQPTDVSQKKVVKRFPISNCSAWQKREEGGILNTTLFEQTIPLTGEQHTLEFNDVVDAQTGRTIRASEVSLKVSLEAKRYTYK